MDKQTFDPDVHLEHGEQALLAATTATPGYRIMHRIFRAEVDRFILNLINVDAASEKDVIAKHILAKSAAQFYQAITNRINEEVLQYTAAVRTTDTPTDDTEGVLDLGNRASTPDDLYEASEEGLEFHG